MYLGFTATATDTDLPANTLTFSLADGTAGSVPAGAAITAGGVFSWTPGEAQGPGSYTFDVVVTDDGAANYDILGDSDDTEEADTAGDGEESDLVKENRGDLVNVLTLSSSLSVPASP